MVEPDFNEKINTMLTEAIEGILKDPGPIDALLQEARTRDGNAPFTTVVRHLAAAVSAMRVMDHETPGHLKLPDEDLYLMIVQMLVFIWPRVVIAYDPVPTSTAKA